MTVANAASSGETIPRTRLVKPTEGQLRYAQFHHKRRAQAVKHRIDRLHQTPLEFAAAVLSEDSESDATTSSETDVSDVELRTIRSKRPDISVGRRALLKHSRGLYRRRTREISKHGFRCHNVNVNTDDDDDDDEVDFDNDENEEDAALDEIFLTRPKPSRRRTQFLQNRTAPDESYQRFQAACHAMMRNIQKSTVVPEKPAPTLSKRWKRTEGHTDGALVVTDFYRYRTSGKGRTRSDRSAALLLSYEYYQQNQKDHHSMDMGASWLTHIPAKQQPTRGRGFYFHTGLPTLETQDEHNESHEYDGDGNESSVTLAMRSPGPQKFHRLMAYVQHKLIEKQQQEQRQNSSPGRRRTLELAASLEPSETTKTSRIRQMADSIEGKNSTPTMTLRSSTTVSSSERKRRGRSRYVPRMRLREFAAVEGSENDEHITPTTPLPRTKLSERFLQDGQEPIAIEEDNSCYQESSSSPPKMKLRESLHLPEEQRQRNNQRTRELSLAFESPGDGSSRGKIQQLRASLEPDATPKMKLRGDFVGDGDDEKKTTKGDDKVISRTSVGTLSQQFQEQQWSSPTTDIVNEFSSNIDPRIVEQFQDRRQSSETNVTQFFARLRNEQQHQLHEDTDAARPLESIRHPEDDSPGKHSDAVSDLSKQSNLSGMWSRGRSSLSTLTSNLNTIAETQGGGGGFLSPELIGRASNVSGRVNGLLNKFRGLPEDAGEDADDDGVVQSLQHDTMEEAVNPSSGGLPQDQPHPVDLLSQPHQFVSSPSVESVAALRAYRNNRASMSPEEQDRLSVASSYHALPDHVRQVIQNSGGKSPLGKPPRGTIAATPSFDEPHNYNTEDERNYASPNRTTVVTQSTTVSQSELSDEQYKRAHGRFLQNSSLLGGEFQHENIIDTDGTLSDASGSAEMDPQVLAKLMMSPDILQKRLKQAIHSVEQWKWDQVLFLINANPWLAEMKELTTNQYLLHKLAFFGKGEPPAPMSLSERLVEKFPAAVYKFDQDGNVPLHLAAASGNVPMIRMLGEQFEGGASIRNEEGMLPLHFTIASLADLDLESVEGDPLEALQTVLKLFPKAVAITDNDGNLPLHVASECLSGSIGVDAIALLMDEAERQLEDPFGARFRNKVKMEDLMEDEMSARSMSEADASIVETPTHSTMVLNDYNETPLSAAIRSHKGWEMVEALVSGPGGREAALTQDANKNNALHLLVGEFQDATAAMSILKIVPECASQRNAEGILPVEIACMQLMPEEVVLAIALVDLPDDNTDSLADRGRSWIFLTCDSDDHMVHVVEEVVSICSFRQLQQLCFLKYTDEQSVLERATPRCREILNRALRFLGRFEFVGDGPLFEDPGFKAFEALDFGTAVDGKKVLLECYSNEFDFENRVYTMFDFELDNRFLEEVNVYVEQPNDGNHHGNHNEQQEEEQPQRCVAIERPRLTLDKVVEGFSKNGGYYDTTAGDKNSQELRLRYSSKICSVLRLIGKALQHLHEHGVVHGNVCMETCGKFEDSWKLLERLDIQPIGKPFDATRFRNSFPPESLRWLSSDQDQHIDSDGPTVGFCEDLATEVSIDVWGFGKLCYESLVGKPLIDFEQSAARDDPVAVLQIVEWSLSSLESVFADLMESGIGEAGAELVTACLFPRGDQRPTTMKEILSHGFWQDIRQHRSPRKGRNRRRRKNGDSVESTVSLLTDVDLYEV